MHKKFNVCFLYLRRRVSMSRIALLKKALFMTFRIHRPHQILVLNPPIPKSIIRLELSLVHPSHIHRIYFPEINYITLSCRERFPNYQLPRWLTRKLRFHFLHHPSSVSAHRNLVTL